MFLSIAHCKNMDEAIVSSKLQEMIESAAANKNKPQEDKQVFFVSKKDMKKFLKKELLVTKSTEEGGPIYEEIGTRSRRFTLKACKNFLFHVYPEKRISKKKRVAAGAATGGTTGGVAGGVAGGVGGGCAGGMGGVVLGGIAGAIIGTLIFPIIGTVIGGIGGAILGGASGAGAGVAAGGAAGTAGGAAVGAAVGAGAGAVNADYKKQKKAMIVTVEEAFQSGIGYYQDENYVYCTVVNDG